MDRREFVKKSVAGLVVGPRLLAAAPAADSVTTADPTSLIAQAPLRPEDDERLRYMPSEKTLQGERYRASFPDTLDLVERMRLAINALTNAFIPEERWALAFEVDFSRRPPELKVNHSTDAWLNIPAKFIEALVNCRLASGSNFNLEVDRKILATQLGLMGDDGLTYAPEGPLPELKGERNYSEIWGEGRLLLALAMLAQVDDNPRWVEIGRRKVDRLLSLSREKDGYRFFWKGRFHPGEVVPPDAPEPTKGTEGGSLADGDAVFSMMYSVGALGYGAGLFYRVTKYPPALELSRGLAKWAMARMFKNADGRYSFYHFHHGTFALMAVAEYAEAAQDTETLRRVDACFRWARQMGDPLVGWFPEFQPGTYEFEEQDFESVEICEVADMVFLALLLTRNGAGDYWDDVDRWVRNMYTEGQMTNADFLKRIPDRFLNPAPGQFRSQRWINIWSAVSKDDREIGLRSVGSFFGWMRANDGLLVLKADDGEEKLSPRSIMHCCTANGARTLYYVWDSIVSRAGDECRVNLLLNRASEWMDVHSYLPVQGKVVLRVKRATKVAVRLPEWVTPSDVRGTVGGRKAEIRVQGRYASIGESKAGDEIELTFPLPERTLYRVLGRRPYKLTLRGSNVVAIDPPGVAYPLYQHQPTGKLVEKACFIPAKNVIW
jgi:hypothetical protein